MAASRSKAAPRKRPTLALLRERRDEIIRVAAHRGASNIRVFGSVARGDAHVGSDIDLLVDFAEGASLLDEVGLAQDLSALLGFDVEIGSAVNQVIGSRVEAETVPL